MTQDSHVAMHGSLSTCLLQLTLCLLTTVANDDISMTALEKTLIGRPLTRAQPQNVAALREELSF